MSHTSGGCTYLDGSLVIFFILLKDICTLTELKKSIGCTDVKNNKYAQKQNEEKTK
jgi:hypothetical protein